MTLTNPGAVADGIRADGVPVTDLRHGAATADLSALPRLAAADPRGAATTSCTPTSTGPACTGGSRPRLAGVRAVVATEHSLGDAADRGPAR